MATDAAARSWAASPTLLKTVIADGSRPAHQSGFDRADLDQRRGVEQPRLDRGHQVPGLGQSRRHGVNGHQRRPLEELSAAAPPCPGGRRRSR